MMQVVARSSRLSMRVTVGHLKLSDVTVFNPAFRLESSSVAIPIVSVHIFEPSMSVYVLGPAHVSLPVW